MKKKGNGDYLLGSFTDLMASLAVIFILLTVVFIKNASQKSKEGKRAVQDGLMTVLDKNKLPLQQDVDDPLTLNVRMDESLLKFATGSAALSKTGSLFLDGFFPSFAKEICSAKIRQRLDAIVIEGHTDSTGENQPGGNQKNIRLSQDRSFSVLSRALASVSKDPELYACVLKMVLASGRGSSMPIMMDGQYNAELSRRVEIKIRVKSNEQFFQGAHE